MDFRIDKIYLTELQKFSGLEDFFNFENVPLSKKRILSYLSNPRKNDALPVLYLAFSEDRLIGFRSVLQDKIEKKSGSLDSIIWISGSWTHPDFRKKGISRKIFDEVSKDYNQNIFITNYGSMSYSLYSKRQDLYNFKFLDGHRLYYRLNLSEILPPKSRFFYNIKIPLEIFDKIGNFILDMRFHFYKKYKNTNIQKAEFNEEFKEFIYNHNQNSLFKRNVEEFNWILDYPWVEQREEDDFIDKKYHFTTSAKRFYQKAVVYRKDEKINGFLFYSVKNEVLKIHYLFVDSELELDVFSSYILNIIRQEKISLVILTDERFIQKLKKKGGFIYSKSWKKGFFVGKKLLEDYPEITEKEIYMGDGDTIFT